ncbi:TIGR03943 family putative permease subunit [Bacillus sp. AK128]
MQRKYIYIIICVLVAVIIGMIAIGSLPEKQNIAEDFLKDPEEYMHELTEKYENHQDHSHTHEDKEIDLESLEQLKSNVLEMDKITVSDDDFVMMMVLLDQDPDSFVGKEIELSGFIYREPEFENTQMVIARYNEGHDGEIYGILSTTQQADALIDGQWVGVKGTLQKTRYMASEVPYIVINELQLMEELK